MKRVIACDLDGTLAEYHGWEGVNHIGPVIPEMRKKVLDAIANGSEVLIFTARANDDEAIPYITDWLCANEMPDLEITCTKHKKFTEFWDDRAVQIVPNTGETVSASVDRDVKADVLLSEMSKTFAKRNALYKDNYEKVGGVMAVLFPDGVSIKDSADFNRWHLFELMIVKLTRFANSGMLHKDSIHDCAIYAAMVESLTKTNSKHLGDK